MIIKEVTPGRKVAHNIMGDFLFINNELAINASRYERDYEVVLDICEDDNFSLVMSLGRRYVAQVTIPAKSYVEVELEGEDDQTSGLEPVPFDINKCTLSLWGLE